MRLNEINLIETSDEELIIQNIAKMCVANAVSYFNNLKQHREEIEDQLLLKNYDWPTIEIMLNTYSVVLKNIIPNDIFDNLYNAFKDIQVVFDISGQHGAKKGEYNLVSNTIYVYTHYYGNSFSNNKSVVSTIVHELRHALDKNKGQPFKNEKIKRYDPASSDTYYRQSYEINARISQALEQTVDQFSFLYKKGTVLTKEEFINAFIENAHINYIMFLKNENPRAYKRIIKRAYDLYNTIMTKISKNKTGA